MPDVKKLVTKNKKRQTNRLTHHETITNEVINCMLFHGYYPYKNRQGKKILNVSPGLNREQPINVSYE